MRWPWERERTEPRTPGATTAPAEPGAGPQVPPAGWAFLPPLQRTVGSVQLTSDPGRFAGALASWGDPSFTGPMAHLISADAPPGVIDVDGGGPAPGHAGYSAASPEMTLLPPPAPRVHAKPAVSGGLPATAQRSVSDGGAPGGSALLTAEPNTFPVLHVDALPLQGPDSVPEPEVSAPSQPVPEPDSVPEPQSSAPTAGADASRPGQPSQPVGPSELSEPGRTDGSTSDGHATYVPLPSAPAVQRASSGTTGASPAVRHAPPPSRLGLGMPLNFSEPPAPEGPRAAWSAGQAGFPVQRSAPSAVPSAPASVPLPAVDDGGDHPHTAGVPEAGAGTANEASARQTDSGAEPSGPPDTIPVQALDAGMGVPVGDPAAGPVEPKLSTPPDDASAPLLSVAVVTESPGGGRDGNAGDVRSGLQAGEGGAPSMPVVSRFGPAAIEPFDAEELGSVGAQEGLIAQPASAGSTAETPGRTLASPPDTGPAHETPAAEPALHAPLVFGPSPGGGSAPAGPAVQQAAGAAWIHPVQRDVSTGILPLQRDAGSNASAETPSSAEGLAQAQGRSVRNPQGDPRDRGQNDGGQADGGKPESGPPSAPPTTLRIQRAARPTPEPHAREIPSPRGPVVLRVVQTASAGITPDSWQRLTAVPPVTGGQALEPAPLRTRTPEPGAREGLAEVLPVSTAAGPDIAGDSGSTASGAAAAAAAASDGGPGVGVGSDIGNGLDGSFEHVFEYGDTSSDPGTGAGFGDGPDGSAEASAAVGRVIQRTLTVGGAGSPQSAAPGPPAGPRYLTESFAGPRTPASASDGPRAASLQRWSTAPATVPGGAGGPARAHGDRPGLLANAALPGFPAGPGFHAGFGPGSETPPPAVLSLATLPERAQAGDVLQRDLAVSAFDSSAAAPGAGGVGTAVSEASDAAPSSPADAGTNPAGPGQQGPEATGRGGAGAHAGAVGTATPEQLEDLAKRLAGPLIRRIKAEMLLDRERRGLRTDAN